MCVEKDYRITEASLAVSRRMSTGSLPIVEREIPMSIASCSELERRREILLRAQHQCAAHNVPREAWPQRYLSFYGNHSVRRRGGRTIHVFLLREAYYVVADTNREVGALVPWEGDAVQAWNRVKQIAGWE